MDGKWIVKDPLNWISSIKNPYMFVSNRSVGYFDILGLITYNEQHALVVKITDTNWINQDFGNLYFNYTIVKEKTDFMLPPEFRTQS